MLNMAVESVVPLAIEKTASIGQFLFHTRLVMQVMVENCSSEDIARHLTSEIRTTAEDGSPESPRSVQLTFPLLSALSSYLIKESSSINNENHYVYEEALKLLITLLGTQLGSTFDAEESTRISRPQIFLDALCWDTSTQLSNYGESINVNDLVSTLLNHVVAQKRFSPVSAKAQPVAETATPEPNDDLESGNTNQNTASDNSAWSAFVELGLFFAFPFQEFARMLTTGDNKVAITSAPIAELSLCPLLVLVNHQSNNSDKNPFRDFLATMGFPHPISSATGSETSSSSSSSAPTGVSPLKLPSVGNTQTHPSFAQLYQCITTHITNDSVLVLLYVLLQTNSEFHRFIASRADLDILILPLLANLYRAHEQTRVRIYTILIVMTILTFDDHFVPSIQAVTIDTPKWFKEKYLPKLPLSELIALVLLRTLQLNLKVIHDDYLHDNCLACLGNLAGQLLNLRFYSAKLLITTFNLFVERYHSLLRKSGPSILASSGEKEETNSGGKSNENSKSSPHLPRPSEENDSTEISLGPNFSSAEGEYSNQTASSLISVLQDTERYVQTLLEIIDCLFRKKPANNVQLIYVVVLDDKRAFESLFRHARLSPLAQQITEYADQFLRAVQDSLCETPQQVVDRIATMALTWKPSNPANAEIANLKFAYQETNAAPFFTPFIWKIFLKMPFIFWNPTSITLYDTGLDPNFAGDDGPEDRPRESV